MHTFSVFIQMFMPLLEHHPAINLVSAPCHPKTLYCGSWWARPYRSKSFTFILFSRESKYNIVWPPTVCILTCSLKWHVWFSNFKKTNLKWAFATKNVQLHIPTSSSPVTKCNIHLISLFWNKHSFLLPFPAAGNVDIARTMHLSLVRIICGYISCS